MADIDDGAGFERFRMVGIELRRKEVAARRAECVGDGADVGLIPVANLDELTKSRRSAHRLGDGRAVCQRTKYALGDGPTFSAERRQISFACAFNAPLSPPMRS